MQKLTHEDLDRLVLDYCQRHGIPLPRGYSTWVARRHPQLARLHTCRYLVARGQQDQIPPGLLDPENELPPLTTTERYRRAMERRREWRGVHGGPIP